MVFETSFRVRLAQVDSAGVVYFSRIYEYCHEAFEDLLIAGGLPLEGLLVEAGWGMPLVHTEADYHRPLRLGEALKVEVRVSEYTARRVSFGFQIIDSDGVVRARAKHVHAAVSMSDFKPREVPSAFLDALKRLDLIAQD